MWLHHCVAWRRCTGLRCSLSGAYRAQGRLNEPAPQAEESMPMLQRIRAVSLVEESLVMLRRNHGSKDPCVREPPGVCFTATSLCSKMWMCACR